MSSRIASLLLGLSAVGAVGVNGCSAGNSAIEQSHDPLLRSDAWKHLAGTWTEAREIESGKRGQYPFDQKGKDKLLKTLDACKGDIDQLAAGGLLTATEATLLMQELPRLISNVQAMRTKDMAMATCYKPLPIPTTAKPEIDRLADRLALLQKLSDTGVLHPLATEKIIESIEKDIAPLANESCLKHIPTNEQAQAKSLTTKAREQIQIIRQLLAVSSMPQWKVISDAWREAVPLAQSGKSTQKQRDHAKQALADACKAANELAQAGSLSATEVALLVAQAARLERDIFSNPPTDTKVTCYDMAFISPAQESLERLSQRLPLLQKLTASGHLNLLVAEKILPAIEEDLQILSSDKEIRLLPPADQDKAKKLAPAVAAQLEKINDLIKQQAR